MTVPIGTVLMNGVVSKKRKLGVVLQKDTFVFYNEVVCCLRSRGIKITLSKVINTTLREVIRQTDLEKFVEVFLNKIYTSSGFSYIHERLNRRYGKSKSKMDVGYLYNVRVALDNQVAEWIDRVTEEIKSVLPAISRSIVVNVILDSIRYKHNKHLCDILHNKLK